MNIRVILTAVLCAAALCPLLLAQSAPQGESEGVVQPTTVPGQWKLYDAPLPPLEQVVGGPQPGRMIYGLYVWTGEYQQLRDSLKKVGWRSFRFGEEMDDATMRMVVEDGVEVMQTLGLRASGAAKRRTDYGSDDEFIADYVRGVGAYLTRYGPGGTFFKENPGLPERPVTHIEVWNEPNFEYMIPEDQRPRPQQEADREALYAKVLPATYQAIKSKWPTVTVVGFGAGGASRGDVRFIQHVHEANPAVKDSYDVLSTHPYVSGPPEGFDVRSWGGYGTAESLKEIRTIMEKFGAAARPVWYTEVGWPISKADGGYYELRGERSPATPLLQGAYICRRYALAIRLGVQRVHVMFATDTDGTNMGVFARDGSRRPAAHAVAAMIKLLPNPRLEGVLSDGADGYYAYRFAPDGGQATAARPIIMAWNVQGPRAVQMPLTASRATVTDMLGHSRQADVSGGVLSLEVGPCPVYIQAAGN
jgi:hypothetical protein